MIRTEQPKRVNPHELITHDWLKIINYDFLKFIGTVCERNLEGCGAVSQGWLALCKTQWRRPWKISPWSKTYVK